MMLQKVGENRACHSSSVPGEQRTAFLIYIIPVIDAMDPSDDEF
jgi:hypothetical protein